MSVTTIVLADDHQVVRHGLRVLLESEPNFRIVGEASDGLEAIELVERQQPDVLVLDLMMPGLNGLEVARQSSHRSPRTNVVILSMYNNEAYVLEALRAGAKAYVLKASTSDELVRAIREVVAGRRYLSPPLSERAIQAYSQKAESAAVDAYETLTTREREILQLAAEGCTNAEIASRLSISPRTAETHRANLMRKLGLHTHTDLIRYALRRGILPIDN
jgi:DNA-binding NarL/FixJ family response regulator